MVLEIFPLITLIIFYILNIKLLKYSRHTIFSLNHDHHNIEFIDYYLLVLCIKKKKVIIVDPIHFCFSSKRFKSSSGSLKQLRRRILPLRDIESNTLNSCGLTQQIKQVDLSIIGSTTPNSAVKSVLKLK